MEYKYQIWPDGSLYDGEYVNGEKEGYGTFDWMDGQLYKGDWKAEKQHGCSEV